MGTASEAAPMAVVHVIRERVRDCSTVAFDEHAIQRMKERNVNEDTVLDVLRNPDDIGLPTSPNRHSYRKRYGSRNWVDVIFEEDPTQIVVISVVASK